MSRVHKLIHQMTHYIVFFNISIRSWKSFRVSPLNTHFANTSFHFPQVLTVGLYCWNCLLFVRENEPTRNGSD
jgi:hypothetical protein